jgi:23S rRNA G2445 N2-methylase RlmL
MLILDDALFEAEFAAGLESTVTEELRQHGLTPVGTAKNGLQFTASGDLKRLNTLRSVVAVYLVLHFPVPRPRALLGHQHFQRLITAIVDVRRLSPAGTFRTFSLSAAGEESSVMQRLKEEIATLTGLSLTTEAGDLHLRVRRSAEGWDVLIRLTPRPLSVRPWRVRHYEAALNAPTAYAMIRRMQPAPDDQFVNLACGSGTLLIERAFSGPARGLIGVDRDRAILESARENIQAGRLRGRITLLQADITQMPLPSSSVNALCADLPFGQNTGSHEENVRLYPGVLREAARIAQPGARFALITHEIRLMDTLLADAAPWTLITSQRVDLRGLHPRIYLLQRR